MGRRKKYKGHEPGSDKWFLASDSDDWEMFVKTDDFDSGDEWINVKFCAKKLTKHKANYQLAWSRVQGRFSSSVAFHTLDKEKARLTIFTDMVKSFINE